MTGHIVKGSIIGGLVGGLLGALIFSDARITKQSFTIDGNQEAWNLYLPQIISAMFEKR